MSPGNAKTFLFDLDMTLVDSAGQPFLVKGNPAPHELPTLLKNLGHKVGIVTSARRAYAKKILQSLNIAYDCLVAFEDTRSHKPHPEPIEYALKKLSARPDTAFFIGDSASDAEASFHAGVTSIGAGWGIPEPFDYSTKAADILIYSPKKILSFDRLESRRYAGEFASPRLHRGSFLKGARHPKTHALGRYFSAEDRRHATSDLSRRLIRLKEDDLSAPFFTKSVLDFLDFFKEKWTPDAVLSVPPKPGQRNRFEKIISPFGALNASDGLIRTRDIADYKSLSEADRAQAMFAGEVFKSTRNWAGKRVLLIDDIYSSGSTVLACSKALLQGGASEVRALVFGRAQTNFQVKHCPLCNRFMHLRSHGRTREVFWVCSGFPLNLCKVALPLDVGQR